MCSTSNHGQKRAAVSLKDMCSSSAAALLSQRGIWIKNIIYKNEIGSANQESGSRTRIHDQGSMIRIRIKDQDQDQDQEGWQGGAQRWRRTQSAAACMCSKAPISIGAFELVVQRSRQSVSLKTPSTAESATWRSCKPFCNCQNQLFQRNGQRYWPPRFELLSVRHKKIASNVWWTKIKYEFWQTTLLWDWVTFRFGWKDKAKGPQEDVREDVRKNLEIDWDIYCGFWQSRILLSYCERCNISSS